jgi:hypothetical protein
MELEKDKRRRTSCTYKFELIYLYK